MTPDPREVLTRSAPEPDRVEHFGPAPHQLYDVYLARGQARSEAWVVLVHGGFWRAEFDRTHLRPLAVALVREGHHVALVEFRGTGMEGGGWPGTGTDVVEAVSQVLDREQMARFVLAGHSAGGQLAVWLTHQRPLPGCRGVISLAGCLDLVLVAEQHLGDGAAAALMGGTPQQRPADYRLADPAQLGPAPLPVRSIHGTADDRVPVEVTRSWWAAAGVSGRDEQVELDGVEHFALIDPLAGPWPVLLSQLDSLLGDEP